jgi:hypothetical protein
MPFLAREGDPVGWPKPNHGPVVEPRGPLLIPIVTAPTFED